jgi:hypothetical protein
MKTGIIIFVLGKGITLPFLMKTKLGWIVSGSMQSFHCFAGSSGKEKDRPQEGGLL